MKKQIFTINPMASAINLTNKQKPVINQIREKTENKIRTYFMKSI